MTTARRRGSPTESSQWPRYAAFFISFLLLVADYYAFPIAVGKLT